MVHAAFCRCVMPKSNLAKVSGIILVMGEIIIFSFVISPLGIKKGRSAFYTPNALTSFFWIAKY